MESDWQTKLSKELQAWLDPIVSTKGDLERVLGLFTAAGWYVDRLPVGNQENLRNIIADLSQNGKAIFDMLVAPPTKLETFLEEVGFRLVPIIHDIANLATGLPGNIPGNASELPIDLLNWLSINWLYTRHRPSYEALRLLGIIRQLPATTEELNGVVYRTKGAVPQLVFSALVSLVIKPQEALKDTYWPNGFADGGVGAFALAVQLLAFLNVLGLLPDLYQVVSGEGVDPETEPPPPAVNTASFSRLVTLADGTTAEAGVTLELVPVSAGGLGVIATPYGQAEFDFPAGPFRVSLKGTLAANPIRIVPAGVSQVDSVRPNFGATLELTKGDSTTPALHLGDKDGLELILETVSFYVGVMLIPGKPRALLGVDLKSFLFSLKSGEGDGFLTAILPADGISGNASLALEWSTDGGIAIRGGGGLSMSIPTHIQLGPIEIQQLVLSATPAGRDVPIELSASIAAKLGPLAVAIERMGVTAKVSLPEVGGNLGPFNVTLGFRPPNGVGLAIDASVVKGGGYLYFDFDKGEYAGALELTISNWLSLKAIGLINTKLPGGQPGFSLLVIITAEFNPGFQLGYGFVLLGVGGLLGLNRVMLLDPLLHGVRTGAINSIVFPTNVVANAPKILSDLRTIFPPQEGTFLIGPMAKIGWTTLITLSLGVIIEIPGNVVILGRLGLILPDADDPVLILQVSFVGALEFDKRRIWFFATLFDSRVLFITLEGEMGLLMDFSDNPNFVLSVGGFHPRFTPPPLPFPSLARITLSILNESWGRLRAETYFAVTSNSVQMGCRVEAFFGYDAFSIEGYFSFDALLRFSPLYLIVEISTGFSLKVFGVGVFGVRLRGSLEGPTPWHIHGSAEISFLFFSFSADVDRTFGESRTDTLPPIEVLPKIHAEFEKLESWRATLPASGQLYVSLRDLGSSGTLVLHPVGRLQISQRFAPLNLPLDKIGNQKPSDVKKVTVAVTTSVLAVKGPTKEKFAAAQYREMDDAAKLSAPAYEPLESGVELGAAGRPWATGPLAQRIVRYEFITLDTAFQRTRTRFFKFWDGLFVHFRAGAAVSRAVVSLANEKRMQPFSSKVTISAEQYAVAFQADNRAYTSTATYSSYAEAQAHMTDAVQLDPSLSEEIHVIPLAEVNQSL